MAIYMDNAATTNHKPQAVVRALNEYIQNNSYGNPLRGAHSFSVQAYDVVESCRDSIKTFFNCTDAYEVAFNYNATSVLNIVIKGLLGTDGHVITSSFDHNATLRPLYQLAEQGLELSVIPLNAQGVLDLSQLDSLLQANTKAVVINHASNLTGNYCDLQVVKEFCKQHHLYLIVDVSQSAGVCPIDLADETIDAICFTAHKSLYGITGLGGCCIKKQLPLKPVLSGGDGVYAFEKQQPASLPGIIEVGTINVVGCVALKAGIDYLLELGMDQVANKHQQMHDYFVRGIQDLQNIHFYGDLAHQHLNTFAFNVADIDSSEIADYLWENYEIATRCGFHCAPLMHKALHTDKQGCVRVSFSLFTTLEEIDVLLSALHQIDQEV